jgi:hypothetical protein
MPDAGEDRALSPEQMMDEALCSVEATLALRL